QKASHPDPSPPLCIFSRLEVVVTGKKKRVRKTSVSTVLPISADLFRGRDMVMVLSPLFLVFMLDLGLTPQTLAQNDAYRGFLRKHYDPSPTGHDDRYCNTMMERRSMTRPCKDTNTFIHGNSNDIRAVCDDRNGEPYRNGLRRSRSPFQVTTCKHRGGSPRPPCRYRAFRANRVIVIRCRDGFPIHLEE
ncbi:Angiogenin-2, partial [Bos mutus]